MKLLQTIAASILVLGMGSALAEEPITLTEAQMDNVNAGIAAASAGISVSGIIDTLNASLSTSTTSNSAVASAQASATGRDLNISVFSAAFVLPN